MGQWEDRFLWHVLSLLETRLQYRGICLGDIDEMSETAQEAHLNRVSVVIKSILFG